MESERHWRDRTVDALAAMLTWYARREAGRVREAPAANDTTPNPSTTPAEEGVPSPAEKVTR